jgi:hypothetical protein
MRLHGTSRAARLGDCNNDDTSSPTSLICIGLLISILLLGCWHNGPRSKTKAHQQNSDLQDDV